MALEYISRTGRKRIFHTDIEEVRKELQKVADELGLPIEDERVVYEWGQRGNTSEEVSERLIAPVYFPIRKNFCHSLSLEEKKQLLALSPKE
jgi:hypothetical protein